MASIRHALGPVAMAAGLSALLASGASGQNTPVPRPFPGAGSTPGAGSGSQPAPAPAPVPAPPAEQAPAPTPAPAPDIPPVAVDAPPAVMAGPDLGDVPVYPTAVYLDSYDAGFGQVYHLYGTETTYDLVVTYYRNVFGNGGREIYQQPAVRQFDLGPFRENRMAFPPSVVVKDYRSGDAPGYPFVSGTTETRYPTVIQVVLPDPADR